MNMRDSERTTVKRGQQDAGKPVHYSHDDQRLLLGDSGVKRRHRQTIRYNGACGYYICYSIFVAVVGLTLLAVILTLHLVRCIVVVTDLSVYDCFIGLRLSRPAAHHRHPTAVTH